MKYPRVQARWPLTDDAIDKYLGLMEAVGFLVELPTASPRIVSDPVVSDPDATQFCKLLFSAAPIFFARVMRHFGARLSKKSVLPMCSVLWTI